MLYGSWSVTEGVERGVAWVGVPNNLWAWLLSLMFIECLVSSQTVNVSSTFVGGAWLWIMKERVKMKIKWPVHQL